MQIYMQQSCELVCLQVIYVAETTNSATFISASPSSFVINNAMSTRTTTKTLTATTFKKNTNEDCTVCCVYAW